MWGITAPTIEVMGPYTGSPPRMWGITAAAPEHEIGNLVHPHACGESLVVLTVLVVTVRFTPTHVGITCEPIEGVAYSGGSPPRMWGSPLAPASPEHRFRFTPTHVGITCEPIEGVPTPAVHPHACGDHLLRQLRLSIGFGSPPRMWGSLHAYETHCACIRFTPTHVGITLSKMQICVNVNPSKSCAGRPVYPVHPHSRVATTHRQPDRTAPRSVHPYALERHEDWPALPSQRRFIPTNVGGD